MATCSGAGGDEERFRFVELSGAPAPWGWAGESEDDEDDSDEESEDEADEELLEVMAWAGFGGEVISSVVLEIDDLVDMIGGFLSGMISAASLMTFFAP